MISHRVNILLDEPVWEALKTAPKGERSRLVNRALTDWFEQRNGKDAARRMDVLRSQLPAVSTEQVVAWLREDRGRYE